MSYSTALAEAKRLKSIVESYGVKCTIELMDGRPWTGSSWYAKKYILMNHHTAGSSSGNTPSLYICKYGRTGIPGPLCNGYGGRDKVFRIITMGLANHPGAGGPLTRDGVTMPKDSARIASFGIEWEHNGTSAWPADMKEFMGKVGAAVMDWMKRPTTSSVEHSTWAPTRKIDRNTFTASSGGTLINQYRGKATGGEEEDMPYKDWPLEDRQQLAEDVSKTLLNFKIRDAANTGEYPVATFIRWGHEYSNRAAHQTQWVRDNGSGLRAGIQGIIKQEFAAPANVSDWANEQLGDPSTRAQSRDGLLGYAAASGMIADRNSKEVIQLREVVNALSEVITKLPGGEKIDIEAIKAAAREGAAEGAETAVNTVVGDADVKVTFDINPVDEETA